MLITCDICGVGYEPGVETCKHSDDRIDEIAKAAARSGTLYGDLSPGLRDEVDPHVYAYYLDISGFPVEAEMWFGGDLD